MQSFKMSKEQALQIANTLFNALDIVYQFVPLQLANCIDSGQMHVTTVVLISDISSKGALIRESTLNYADCKKSHPDNVHILVWKNRTFEITIYDSPEPCGYYSPLSSYDDTYIFCNIKEIRKNGSKKYEIAFAFDFERMAVLELFDIDHYTTNGCIRESGDSIEPDLKGRIISFPKKYHIVL